LKAFHQYCILKGIAKFTYLAKKYKSPEFFDVGQKKLKKLDLTLASNGDRILFQKEIDIDTFERWAGLKAEFY